MRKASFRPTLRGLVLGLAVAALSSQVIRAHPYASRITNTGGTISFILNETADTVGVYFPDNNSTNFLGANLSPGVHTFTLGPGTNRYVITVDKIGTGAVSQISNDTNRFNIFYGPRGVAVNKNPKTGNFGRTYVVNANTGTTTSGGTTRTVTWGVYAVNADGSDAVGQGDTASTCNMTRVPTSVTTTYSPYKISVGPDDMVYVGDACGQYYGGNTNGVYMVTPDLSFGTNLFPLYSDPEVGGGVVGTPIAFGSYAAGTLSLYTYSWDLQDPTWGYQTIWLYNNFTTLPFANAPQPICNAGIGSVQGVSGDLAIGPDGKIFTLEYRGTPAAGSVPIYVFSPDGTTQLWDSWDNWVPAGGDPFAYNRSIAISQDGKFMLTSVGNTGNFTITRLTNGIPDPSTFTLVSTGFGATSYGVAFDAADNVYITTSGKALLRVYSLGFTTTAITSNDATTTNGTFQLITPSTTVSVVATVPVTSQNTTQPAGQFAITRTGSTASALTVPFTLTGTATNGVQYTNLALSATIPVGQTTANVFIQPKPISVAGPTRTAILTLKGGPSFTVAAPFSDTVYILDTNTPSIHVAVKDTQLYERTNDYARFTLTRWGDTNVYLPQVNLTYGGTATEGTQFYPETTSTNFNQGDVNVDVYVYPIHDGMVTGPLTVTATVAPAGDASYVVGTPATSGPTTRVDSDDPPETVLWSDNLQTDTSANWTKAFAAAPDPTDDETVIWGYDYYGNQLIPPAPHSGSDTHGLFMTVNKNDAIAASAALNFYPNGQSFSGNYAFRFDMFLIENDTSYTTEYALFGINHSGTKTNWFRNSTTTFVGVDPVGWNFDGIFYDVESDGAHLGDYVCYSSPTTANHNPTNLVPGVTSTTLTGVFKAPPWTVGLEGGGAAANGYGSSTPIWADVEVAQINGVIYWSINHTLIFAYTNATPYTSGKVMLGYEDGYDSIGSTGGGVIYANARVISLAGPYITKIVHTGGDAEITFTGNASDVAGQFVLQSAGVVSGPYADTTSTISSLGGGVFKAVKAAGSNPSFYRIRRVY